MDQHLDTDDALLQQLRADLDKFVGDARIEPPMLEPVRRSVPTFTGRRVVFGLAAASIVALVGGLVLLQRRGDVTPTTTPATTAAPATPTTSVPAAGVGQRYEVVATVLENADHGPQLCVGGVADSLPPQCGGPDIDGWSWDAIDAEQSASGTTWVDAYVTGTYDATANRFTVDGARAPTEADRDSIGADGSQPDYGVPCPEPTGGWPARKQEWPGDQVSAIDGYAGAWTDSSQQVMVVKFTGDLTAAEQAVRTYYSGSVCVIGAEHTEAELRAIQEQLTAMSSVQFLWSAVYADVTGEWVEAGVIAPDPARQAAFDAEWGAGVVRLVPALRPIDG